jgi:peptidoglycan/LPS O-acetylase OafA/YrhL
MIKYQPEVDGLRAIAVLPVVMFHAGVNGFGGGFVGVDVFFVISGYLITSIIVKDLAEDRFSLSNFYERRIRRIIPALMLVVLASLVAGMVLFLPSQLRGLSLSALNTATFTSNIWFWYQTGYFTGSSPLEPLLHTWSLAVEEQFYVIFPIALWVMHRLRIPLLPSVLVVLVCSLIGSAVLVFKVPSATFYLLPTRAWELMVGSAISLGVVPSIRGRRARELLAALGLLLIVVPVLTYSDTTIFPGLAAIPPCLGAALVIVAGRQGGGTVTDVIGSRLLRGIGLISYSLYLWHWPVLVFARQYLLTRELPAEATLLAVALSSLLAWVTWRFVEAPFRDRSRMSGRAVFKAGLGITASVSAVAISAAVSDGFPQRLDARTVALAAGQYDRPATLRLCQTDRPTKPCRIGMDGPPPSFAVWGDSHAAALGEAVGIVARSQGVAGSLFAFNGCPPAVGAPSPGLSRPDWARCSEWNERVQSAIIRDRTIQTVVLIGFWQFYVASDAEKLADRLGGTLRALNRSGKQVVVLADLPAPNFDVPWMVATSSYYGRSPPQNRTTPGVDPRLAQVIHQEGARLISLAPPLCPRMPCDVQRGGKLLFFDSSHVTAYANRAIIAPYLSRSGMLQLGNGDSPVAKKHSASGP